MASGLTALSASRVLGANDIIRVAAIGCGERMNTLLHCADVAGGHILAAVCDVYEPHRDAARARFNPAASSFLDYREVLDKPDINAVIVAVPNHSHVRVALDVLSAHKDIYLEKPVTHTLAEGPELIRAVRSSKQILQSGMQQRSWEHFQTAVDLIQAGNLGRITQIRTYWYQNYQTAWPSETIKTDLLDWKRWLGSAPAQPFDPEKYNYWRWFWDFGGGAMTDLFTHWIDVAHWAMKKDQADRAQTMGDRYIFTKWQCPDTIQSSFRYPGFEVGYEGTLISSIDDGGLEFRGTKATLKIDRQHFAVYREGIKDGNPVLTERSFKDGTISHMQNFLDCVRDRKQPNAPVEVGVSCARAGHFGNYALRHTGQATWPVA